MEWSERDRRRRVVSRLNFNYRSIELARIRAQIRGFERRSMPAHFGDESPPFGQVTI